MMRANSSSLKAGSSSTLKGGATICVCGGGLCVCGVCVWGGGVKRGQWSAPAKSKYSATILLIYLYQHMQQRRTGALPLTALRQNRVKPRGSGAGYT